MISNLKVMPMDITKTERRIFSFIVLFAISIFAITSIYAIANYFGIHLATKQYQQLISMIRDGAGAGSAWYALFGTAVPGWLLVSLAAFGTTSA